MTQREVLLYSPRSQIEKTGLDKLVLDGWRVHRADNLSQASSLLERFDFRVGLAILGSDSIRGTEYPENFLLQEQRRMEWIALLPQLELENSGVCRFISDHFYDYHTLPLNPGLLQATLGHAYGMVDIARCSVADGDEAIPGDEEMVGVSTVMRETFATIRKFASVDAPVLIAGESGTGKELTARAIHERSGRRDGPLVTVNCGSLPANLIQSELFGHEKGSFTGAHQRKIGRFEAAAGGTIFLDEIGDLPLDLQANLLRFLQERTIERVGGTESIEVDVRVIAATHVDLEKAVAARQFREDLYYRLNVLHLRMPALREREGDIEVLAKYMFKRFSGEKSRQLKGFSQQAMEVLLQHDWPGNVRELINRIRRAMVMCDGRLIAPADLGLDRRRGQREIVTLEQARNEAERRAVLCSLRQNRNNVTQAARQLSVSRVTLYRLMEKHGISI